MNPEISNLRPEEVGQLTDREAWEWYLKPALDRAERMRNIRDGYGDTGTAPPEPQTVEEQLQWLRDIGVQGVPDTPEG